MPQPVTDTVHFTLNVRSHDRGDHWATESLDTGVFTYGDTQEEAETLTSEFHVKMVRQEKTKGRRALARFMKDAGIEFRVGGPKPAAAARRR